MSSRSPRLTALRLRSALFAGALFLLGSGSNSLLVFADDRPDSVIPAKVHYDDESIAPLQKGTQPKGARGVYRDKVTPHWFAGETKFWYRNDLKGGTKEFVLVDAEKGTRGVAFDHAKLATALSKAAEANFRADRLPFNDIEFSDDAKSVQFDAGGKRWKCDLENYTCTDLGPARKKSPNAPADTATTTGENLDQPESPWVEGTTSESANALPQAQPKRDLDRARSPDGKWTALVKDSNLFLRDADGNETQLTKDGKEGSAYGRVNWSPDSKSLVAFRTEPGDRKEVHLIESSPPGGGRAVLSSRPYDLPGDKFPIFELHVFDVENKKELPVEDRKIPLASSYETPRLRWSKDGHTFTYQQTDRGHQRFRLIEVDARTGKSRNLIDEKTETFIWTAHTENLECPDHDRGSKSPTRSFTSPRSDGWRHLYLVDAKTGEDQEPDHQGASASSAASTGSTRRSGRSGSAPAARIADQDPYFIHYYRVNFDGTGLVALTEGNGTHTVSYSPDRKYLIDTYSAASTCRRSRAAPSSRRQARLQARRSGHHRAEGERLEAAGGVRRQGPRRQDRHLGHHLPAAELRSEQEVSGHRAASMPGRRARSCRRRSAGSDRYASLTDLGFIVVQIDGMGTANRSKAFHDVCWQNLKDAGFPDRILWHKAVAAKYPYYDITRVGIYGTSAGGQNATGAVLFHPAISTRSPSPPAAATTTAWTRPRGTSSGWATRSARSTPSAPTSTTRSGCTGKLLLIVGEMDTNVPPESTMRVVDALIKAGKDFDLLVVPGMGHGNGGAYGTRRMQDFFVRHLQGVEPPDRNGGVRGAGEGGEQQR